MGKYYSDYDSADFYQTSAGLLKRANCYGYALRMFYAPNLFPLREDGTRATNYKQQPGEFAVKTQPIHLQVSNTEHHYISNYQDLYSVLGRIFDRSGRITNESLLNAIVTLVSADASTLGYTLTEYTGDTIPSATAYRNKRLIAIVATKYDYHFYMQHSDDTWSHKQADSYPSNKCITCQEPLTNESIKTHACEGTYHNGAIRFFYVTKNTTVDFKHLDGTNSSKTSVYIGNVIGDHRFAAEDIGDLPEDYISGTIDYPGDIDYYSIYTSDMGTRTMYIGSSGYNVKICVYDSVGTPIASQTTTSSAYFTVDFEIDAQYYISVEALNYTTYQNGVSYTFW